MTFQDQLKLDNDIFLNTDEFAETISYESYVRPNVYDPVSIKAVVTRNLPRRISESTVGIEHNLEISIANNATTGRTTIKTGQDRVIISDRIGGTTEKRTVLKILDGDSAMWRLGLN